jgi:hypothetical protein
VTLSSCLSTSHPPKQHSSAVKMIWLVYILLDHDD